jgi:hypothetical protein
MAAKNQEHNKPKQPIKTKYLCTQDSTITLKERVFLKMDQYPNIKTRELCRLLQLNYKKYKETLWSYRHEWKKTKSSIATAQKAQTHSAKASCYALESFDRELALETGWIQSKNRNKALIWKVNPTYGRIVWYRNGKILISIKKPQIMARVKRLLSIAFFQIGLLFDPKLLKPFLDGVRWHQASDVFEAGKKLPYKKILSIRNRTVLKLLLEIKATQQV